MTPEQKQMALMFQGLLQNPQSAEAQVPPPPGQAPHTGEEHIPSELLQAIDKPPQTPENATDYSAQESPIVAWLRERASKLGQ